MRKIKVLLVDDHHLVRTGIRRLLEDQAGETGIEVVGEASSGEEAITLARSHRPEVVMMDVSMPGIGGMEATRRLLGHDPDLKIIALTVHAEGPFPRRLLKIGAMGYLTKGCGVEEMILAIRKAVSGEHYISSDIAQQLALASVPGNQDSPFDALSQREMQVLLMITEGYRAQAISKQLSLSPKTISTYKSRLQEKLKVKTDVELVRLALRHGVVGQGNVH